MARRRRCGAIRRRRGARVKIGARRRWRGCIDIGGDSGFDPERAAGLDEPGKLREGAGFGAEFVSGGDMNFEAGEVLASAVEQGDDSGLREEIRRSDGGAGILMRGESAREGVGDVGGGVYAFVKIVAEQVRAKLEIEQERGDADHGGEKHDGHDGDENVGDDEAVAQAPEEALARPTGESHDEVAGGDEKNEEEPSAEEGEEAAEGSGPGENGENDDGGGEAVERRGGSPEGAEAVKGWHG